MRDRVVTADLIGCAIRSYDLEFATESQVECLMLPEGVEHALKTSFGLECTFPEGAPAWNTRYVRPRQKRGACNRRFVLRLLAVFVDWNTRTGE